MESYSSVSHPQIFAIYFPSSIFIRIAYWVHCGDNITCRMESYLHSKRWISIFSSLITINFLPSDSAIYAKPSPLSEYAGKYASSIQNLDSPPISFPSRIISFLPFFSTTYVMELFGARTVSLSLSYILDRIPYDSIQEVTISDPYVKFSIPVIIDNTINMVTKIEILFFIKRKVKN